MVQHSNDGPLKELKHDAVPGYLMAFIVAFAVMGVYLAVILVSSPGSAKKKYKSAEAKTAVAETAETTETVKEEGTD